MTPSFSAHLNQAPFSSHAGVGALLDDACQQEEARLIGELLTPLFPAACPWKSLADLPEKTAKQHAPALRPIAEALWQFRQALTATAEGLRGWLDASDDDVRTFALRCAKVRFPGRQKLAWAERVTGAPIPGKSTDAQWARINDARFWRRSIRARLLREREHFFLRLHLIGRGRETYVSDKQLHTRTRQLSQQKLWMQQTVLVPRYIEAGEDAEGPLTLAQVASNPRTRFNKLYAFTKAMDEIAQAEGLAAAMLTKTLEPAWHPNPSHGEESWNGASPREAHRSMASRWQSILRDLDRAGVGLSGLRVVEPHKDGCPHWHSWILYKPEAEIQIMATVMKYFPGKLKIRAPSRQGQKLHPDDRIYESRGDLLAGVGRPLRHSKEGAQVELSRIDRSLSSGASYAMKYLLKTVDAGEKLNQDVDLFGPTMGAELEAKRIAHQEAAKRVDAYRGLWGMNAGQLFGVAKCLSAWDELRRLGLPPVEAKLHRLWVLARGSDKPGRIAKGAGQRGNPREFIEALGGLAACGKPSKDGARLSIERLTTEAKNGYGESIRQPKGICLVERRQEKVRKGQVNRETGEFYARSGWRSVKTVLASVTTRFSEWVMASAKKRSLTTDAEWVAKQRETLRQAFESQPGNKAKGWDEFRKEWVKSQPSVESVQSPAEVYAGAARLSQERAAAKARQTDPAWLGKQAVRQFWSACWSAWEKQCQEERWQPRAVEKRETPRVPRRALEVVSCLDPVLGF